MHDEILDVVRRCFCDFEEGMLGGAAGHWSELHDRRWPERYDFACTIEHAEVVESSPTHAIVDARILLNGAAKRGQSRFESLAEGPIVLERAGGSWRILDYTVNGRRRTDMLVMGPLAEQRQRGVTLRVLALERATGSTSAIVELRNASDATIRLRHAYALVESEAMWSRMRFEAEPIEPGATTRIVVSSAHQLPLDETLFAVALDVRTTRRHLPFVVKVPTAKPDEVVPQAAPRMLPLARASWPRNVLVYAVMTALAGWWYGWLAILLPISVGLMHYEYARSAGRLPERLDRLRFLIDGGVVVAAVLVVWFSPAVDFAVPLLVTIGVYLALLLLRRRNQNERLVTALAAGFAW